jgi:hypothetical protein
LETTEYHKGEYTISTDKAKLDIGVIHDYLSNRSYWAEGRPLEMVKRSIEHSLCFGVFKRNEQVGFARVVTDYATFAWLCDLFILESYRGQDLSKWLVRQISSFPALQDLRLFILATRDAHDLYRRYGRFESLQAPDRWMIRRRP